MRESTKRCPYCKKRIPTDAAWCKFCKRDLTEDLVSSQGISVYGEKEKSCPKCDRDMRYIEEYDRWYCPECGQYR
ncbi:MAG: zinc ribbon domain-containing protein [Candidatus Thermoplasmatota archaeon]